jgi:D-sedoheptulose 7-phosphate isomerase|nr:SIS domain-containing protein [Candidatus Krumholzibacteria bacterium]
MSTHADHGGPSFTADLYRQTIADLQAALARLDTSQLEAVEKLALAIKQAWGQGGQFLICGNGGSAADSQHIAAELVGRFLAERPGYRAEALTVNTSTLTAVGNDYGFDHIFSRQVQAKGRPGDVLLVISTSGNSKNCILAVEEARRQDMAVFGFLGGDGGQLLPLLDGAMVAPSAATPRIQEIHITMGHLLCQVLEEAMGCNND